MCHNNTAETRALMYVLHKYCVAILEMMAINWSWISFLKLQYLQKHKPFTIPLSSTINTSRTERFRKSMDIGLRFMYFSSQKSQKYLEAFLT